MCNMCKFFKLFLCAWVCCGEGRVRHIVHNFFCYNIVCFLLQVSLHREFIFRNSKQSYRGIPVVASNMDTVGTFEAALALGSVSWSLYHMCVKCLH